MVTTRWIPYCGAAPLPAEWLGRWNFDPLLLAALTAIALACLRLPSGRRTWGLMATGVATVVFVSPLCALSSALFSARTVHHLLLLAVIAPLAAMALPKPGGRPLAVAAALVQAVVFWVWHAPSVYGWALSDDGTYWLMQVTLLGSAVWFWMMLRIASVLGAVAALLVATVLMGLLGAILTLAPAPFYAPHLISAEAWGIGALRDQQIAGLIMWAPAAALYLAAALWRLGREIGPRHAPAAA